MLQLSVAFYRVLIAFMARAVWKPADFCVFSGYMTLVLTSTIRDERPQCYPSAQPRSPVPRTTASACGPVGMTQFGSVRTPQRPFSVPGF